MAARQRVSELQAYKDRLRRQREIQNLDERIYLDQVADEQSPRRPGPPIAAGNRDRLPLARDRDVRQLQIEYERAREGGVGRGAPRGRGRGRGRGRPLPPGPFHPPRPMRRPVARVEQTAPETPRYNPHNDPKVQMLAENHGRQMEFLHGKNKELERQREEIRRRLEELGRRPPAQKDNSHEDLLRELREQEERNQRLLEELRRQLMEARRPVNIIRTHQETTAGRESPAKKNFIYPLYYGNSLVAEIVAVRQAYLQNGGNDPDILAQLAQMQAEAQAIEDAMRNAQQKQPKSKKHTTNITANFSSLELENERLMRQLQLLQEQKMIASNRRKDNREDELEYEIKRMQREHLRKMYELQREIERLRQEQLVERMRLEMQAQQPTKIVLQQPADGQPPPPPQIVQIPAPAPAPAPIQYVSPAPAYMAAPQQLPAAAGGPYVDVNMMDAAPYDQYSRPPVDNSSWRKELYAKERYYNLDMFDPLPRIDPYRRPMLTVRGTGPTYG